MDLQGSFDGAGDGDGSADGGGGRVGPARSRRDGGSGRWALSFERAERLTVHCVRNVDPVIWGFCGRPVGSALSLCIRSLQSVVDEARVHADIRGAPPAVALALILSDPPAALRTGYKLAMGFPASALDDFETFVMRILVWLVAAAEASCDAGRLDRLRRQLVEVQGGGIRGVLEGARHADSNQLGSFWPADMTAVPCSWVVLRHTMGYGDFTSRHAARQLLACGVDPAVFNAPPGFVFNHRGRLMLSRRASRWAPPSPLRDDGGRRASRWAPSSPVVGDPRPNRRASRWAPSNPATQQA